MLKPKARTYCCKLCAQKWHVFIDLLEQRPYETIASAAEIFNINYDKVAQHRRRCDAFRLRLDRIAKTRLRWSEPDWVQKLFDLLYWNPEYDLVTAAKECGVAERTVKNRIERDKSYKLELRLAMEKNSERREKMEEMQRKVPEIDAMELLAAMDNILGDFDEDVTFSWDEEE